MTNKEFNLMYAMVILISIAVGFYGAIVLEDIRFLYSCILLVLILNIVRYYRDQHKEDEKHTDASVLVFLILLMVFPIVAILIVTFI